MKLIIANILWYAFIIYGLVGAAYNRHSSSDWSAMADVRLKYDLLYGSLALFLILCSLGLILKKKWGYSLALAANATLTSIPLSIFMVSCFMLFGSLPFFEIIHTNAAGLTSGTISLVLLVCLIKTDKKNLYSENSM